MVCKRRPHAVFCSLHVQTMLFTLFSAYFLVQLLSNCGDRGLRVRVITATAVVRLWCLLAFACDELTAFLWRVDRVTSRPGDELTCDELTVCRVDWVTRWPCDELTGSPHDSQPFPSQPKVVLILTYLILDVVSIGKWYLHNIKYQVSKYHLPTPEGWALHYNWPMSAHASQAFSIAHCIDSEDLPPQYFSAFTASKHIRKSANPHIRILLYYASILPQL